MLGEHREGSNYLCLTQSGRASQRRSCCSRSFRREAEFAKQNGARDPIMACFPFHLTGCCFCAPPDPSVLEMPSTQSLESSLIYKHSLSDLT